MYGENASFTATGGFLFVLKPLTDPTLHAHKPCQTPREQLTYNISPAGTLQYLIMVL